MKMKLKDEDKNTVSGGGHNDDVFAIVQSQVKNVIKNYSYKICDNQSELTCALKINFHSNLQRTSFSHIFQLQHTSSASSILYGHVHIRTCNLFFRFRFIFIFQRHYGCSFTTMCVRSSVAKLFECPAYVHSIGTTA